MEDVKPRDITLNDLPSVFAREMLRGGEVALVDAGLNKLMGNGFNLERTAVQALGIGMQRTARDYAEGYTSKAQQDYRQAAEQTVNQAKRSKQLNQFGMYSRNHQQGSGAAAHYGKGNKTSTSKLDKANTINWLTADPESLTPDVPILNISKSSNHNLTVANTTNKWLNFAKEVKGFGEAIYDNVSGLMSNAPTPTSMTQKMTRIMLGENPIDVFINPTAIKNNLVAMYDDIHSMNPELKGYGWGNITFFGATAALPGGLIGDVEKLGVLNTENTHLLSSVSRISSNVINSDFISEYAIAEGWRPPYSDNLSLRKIITAQELKLFRVHVDPDRVAGQFLVREKEIAPFLNNTESLRLHLGLPDAPIYITEVNVPAKTELIVGRIGPQPSFGLMKESGFQYQIIGYLPEESFINTRPILQSRINLNNNY